MLKAVPSLERDLQDVNVLLRSTFFTESKTENALQNTADLNIQKIMSGLKKTKTKKNHTHTQIMRLG